MNDNELVYFESIHLFVELLDQFFGNVCELDLVFNFNKVRVALNAAFSFLAASPCGRLYLFGRLAGRGERGGGGLFAMGLRAEAVRVRWRRGGVHGSLLLSHTTALSRPTHRSPSEAPKLGR